MSSEEKGPPHWVVDNVCAEAMVSWVKILRDDNPIHVDPEAAAALGYGPRTVNPGPINLAYVLNMLMAAEPGRYPARIEARFLDNVLSGDAVEAVGDLSEDGLWTAQLRIVETGAIAVDAIVAMMRTDE